MGQNRTVKLPETPLKKVRNVRQNTIYIANLMLESACDVWRNCQIQNMMKPFHICLGHHKITLKSQEFFSLISAEAVN